MIFTTVAKTPDQNDEIVSSLTEVIFHSRGPNLYLKTDEVSFSEQRFSLEVIYVKFMDWSKAQIVKILT